MTKKTKTKVVFLGLKTKKIFLLRIKKILNGVVLEFNKD